ncbi:MAG: cysteine-rich KTR domain-containing protein [Faecousia sp.]
MYYLLEMEGKVLQTSTEHGKIKTNRRWFVCPRCGRQKLFQLLPTTQAKDLVIYCKVCRAETIVTISPLEPEP